ncbi:MAG: endonuclease/exonuclease/phosphatase family protein [Aggregatilineales bacterium]
MNTKAWWIALTAFLTLLFVQIFRVSTVLILNNVAERNGYPEAAQAMSLVVLAPLALIILIRFVPIKRLFLMCVLALLIVRLGLQFTMASNTYGIVLVGVGVTLALSALTLWIVLIKSRFESADSAYMIVSGIVYGFVLDSVLLASFLTWDSIWQTGLLPAGLAFLICLVVLSLVWRIWTTIPQTTTHFSWQNSLPLIFITPLIMLHLLMLHNAGFIGGATTLALPEILLLLAGVDAIVLFVCRGRVRIPFTWTLTGGVVLIVAELALLYADNLLFVLILLGVHLFSVLIVRAVLTIEHSGAESPETTEWAHVWRAVVAIVSGNVVLGVLGGAYFGSSTVRLPFTEPVLIVFCAILAGAISILLWRVDRRDSWRWSDALFALPALALVVVALGLILTLPSVQVDADDTQTFRIMSYNVRYGVDADGMVDLDALADVIEAQNVDVILLQEVSRGVMTGGGADMATWLSARFGMNYIFSPTRDWQIGNVILSRFPLTAWDYQMLDVPENKTRRSVLSGDYEIGGVQVRVINTHLSVSIPSVERIPEVRGVLAHWDDAPFTLIGGDMNTYPERDDILLFFDAGFISAQDDVGDPEATTYSSTRSLFRVDWIFGTSDITFVDFDIPQTTASDHLPLVATVRLGAEE